MSDQPRPTGPEQGLPGPPSNQRFRAVRPWLSELHDKAQEWAMDGRDPNQDKARTFSYIELIFAFGLAGLGELGASRALLGSDKMVLGDEDDAHQFLLQAYDYRIRQALEGKPHSGPLPDEYIKSMETMDRLSRYVVDRLRKHSRVLEPDRRINPYRSWGNPSDFEKALAELTDISNRQELASRVEWLLNNVPTGRKSHVLRVRALKAGLEVAPWVGEDFARKLLDQSIPAYDALPEQQEFAAAMEQASFLEKALSAAAHYGSDAHIRPLVARFERMLQSLRGPQALPALESLGRECFRGLRKLGMRDEIDRLLGQLADAVLEGKSLAAVDLHKWSYGPEMLKALLQVAAGWYYLGRDRQAEPVLQAARALLLKGELPPRQQTELACAYAQAVGQAPAEVAQERLEEIFTAVKGVTDSYTTSSHYSMAKLDVVESVVLAAVGALTRFDEPLTVNDDGPR
jgi:hypothetical protein